MNVFGEAGEDVVDINTNLLFVQDRSTFVAGNYFHTVLERSFSQFLEEHGLGVGDLLSLEAHLEIFLDLNLSLRYEWL